jgi:alkylation response protein AidB-like acyl-CoA dehydrogenase
MEFRFTAAQEKLRGDIRSFLQDNLSASFEESPVGTEWSGDPDEYAQALTFNKKLAEHGWLTAHWPKEYGGLGLSVMEQVVLREELSYRRAPILNANGLNMLGPVLMLYGTEEQKRQHLPGIARAETMWAQGYSEPNSGSDLASLQTRAVRDGDSYVINGTKIWTGHGYNADWIFVLARTNPQAPKHKGISFLLMPMNSPGLTVIPLQSMTNYVHFCQEYFEDVRVPRENLVGEENQGWYIGATLLDFERSGIGSAAGSRRTLEDLIAFYKENRSTLQPDNSRRTASIRYKLAERMIELETGRSLCYRIASIQEAGRIPNYEASIGKVFFSELGTRMMETGFDVLGLFGQVREGDKWAKLRARFSLGVQTSIIGNIGGGTSEIQRNIIATRGLGLPRG